MDKKKTSKNKNIINKSKKLVKKNNKRNSKKSKKILNSINKKDNKKKYSKKKSPLKSKKLIYSLFIILILLIIGVYNQIKPMPPGTSFEGINWNISDDNIKFVADYTYKVGNETVYEHEIFDELFSLINSAQETVLIDMFLFNNDYNHIAQRRQITNELTDLLVSRTDLDRVIITDRINTFYDSYVPEHIQRLEESGVNIVYTDMSKMRDSNPIYSTLWRAVFQWIPMPFRISHPLGNQDHKVTIKSIFDVLNAKANHRKVAIIDSRYALVTSANPHTASSGHSNVGVLFTSRAVNEIIASEQAIANWSGFEFEHRYHNISSVGIMRLKVLTEGKIAESMLKDISETRKGDSITVMAFYMSDRKIINELKKASRRGVDIILVLDPNKDAFSREKNGIPNRQVARELLPFAEIVWYNTDGEQFHTKMMIIQKGCDIIVHIGSANLTKRNLQDYNLELNLRISSYHSNDFTKDVMFYRNRILFNEDGLFTVPYNEYQDTSRLRTLLYRFQECSGLSTF
ncbi:MAG: phospholipase D-like domain-containing protein [Candidatus Woesearchaeota archaeon]